MSDPAAGFLLIGALFVALTVYFYVGGIGGLMGAAASRRAMRPQVRTSAPASVPEPSLGSLASAPGRAAGAGFSRADALAAIERKFGNDLTPFSVSMTDLAPAFLPVSSLERLAAGFVQDIAPAQVPEAEDEPVTAFFRQNEKDFLTRAAVGAIAGASFRRTLREFSESERHALRLAHVLEALNVLSAHERTMVTVPLVWNEGDCALLPGGDAFFAADRRAKLRDALDDIVTAHFGKKGAAMERVESALRRALDPAGAVTAEDRAVLERHLFAGARWLSPQDDYSNLIPDETSPSALRFGPFYGTSQEMFYDSPQSVFTVAAPGTGKSLLLKRNLVNYKGGAVVLDVKGELYEATAGWRSQNVGPVYRYDPASPAESISFNPLDWIRTDQNGDFAYEDATILARALTFPREREDYWDLAGVRAVATALAKTALRAGRNGRTVADALSAINDIASAPSSSEQDTLETVFARCPEDVKDWLQVLRESGQSLLYDEGRTFLMMAHKQRSSVLEVSRNQLTSWQAGNTFRLSQTTQLRGADLRQGPEGPATLYITIDLDRIDYYRSTVRALLACLYRDLISGRPNSSAPKVTFFIDEMPQLQRMDVLERGLATGRGYGVRFWFFAQDSGQLERIYKDSASSMLDQCAVRIYMNPSEERAQIMSRNVSEREGLLESRRKPLVDPADLYGPEFRDSILVMSQANYPARLKKIFPEHEPKEFQAKLGLAVQEPGSTRQSPAV
ncbi:type IV secretory system conjugative DNA transfer family protein [Bradyrhizobium sp. sGM-13]|uniref:type IV secretory system conjugative DNA transfer family protein n=1 Tax=Bradyrhizobium sp. sGM-13 TaxID=2831781 RepID=UPI001BCFC28C|nr:type IV secretory system conjugative DNA transfer family protein [Bradyrhizobium sp. sGM-13]